MVHQIGGGIGVTSEPGHGTTVEIYLPRANDKGRVAKNKPASVRTLAGAETILVVEDEARVRKLIAGVLRGRGYTVVEATHGEEAVRCAKAHQGTIHLAVVDVIMPEMSGPDLVRQIAPLFPGMRVLYISGYTDEALVDHQIPASGESFLQKPFLPEALARKVREILDKGETNFSVDS